MSDNQALDEEQRLRQVLSAASLLDDAPVRVPMAAVLERRAGRRRTAARSAYAAGSVAATVTAWWVGHHVLFGTAPTAPIPAAGFPQEAPDGDDNPHTWWYGAQAAALLALAAASVALALAAGRTAPHSWQRRTIAAWSSVSVLVGAGLMIRHLHTLLISFVVTGQEGFYNWADLKDPWLGQLSGAGLVAAGWTSIWLTSPRHGGTWRSMVDRSTLVVGASLAGETLWNLPWSVTNILFPEPSGIGVDPTWPRRGLVADLAVLGCGLALGLVAGIRRGDRKRRGWAVVGIAAAVALLPLVYRIAQIGYLRWRYTMIFESFWFSVTLMLSAALCAAASILAFYRLTTAATPRAGRLIEAAGRTVVVVAAAVLTSAVQTAASDSWLGNNDSSVAFPRDPTHGLWLATIAALTAIGIGILYPWLPGDPSQPSRGDSPAITTPKGPTSTPNADTPELP